MPCYNILPYNRLQRVLCRPCSYTANTAKQRTGLYSGVSCDCARSTAHDNRPAQAVIISPAPRWSTSQRRNTSNTYRMPAPRRTLYRPTQPPYYNKVYKGAGVRALLWIHARQYSIAQTMPARRGLDASHTWHGISLALAWHGSAEPLAAAAVSLFGLSPDSQ